MAGTLGVRIETGGVVTTETADHYVLALPIDNACAPITPAMGALDPALEKLRTRDVDKLASWMVGIQFFLYEDVPLVRIASRSDEARSPPVRSSKRSSTRSQRRATTPSGTTCR